MYCNHHCNYPRPYGIGSFLWDVFLVFITGGLWLIGIFVREMRYRR